MCVCERERDGVNEVFLPVVVVGCEVVDSVVDIVVACCVVVDSEEEITYNYTPDDTI